MRQINEVEINFLDKRNQMGRLLVNGKLSPIRFVSVYLPDGFNTKVEYQATLANDWNMSNPLVFQAKTPKGLVSKIKKH